MPNLITNELSSIHVSRYQGPQALFLLNLLLRAMSSLTGHVFWELEFSIPFPSLISVVPATAAAAATLPRVTAANSA